jgi:hypothetical protein
MREKLKGQKYRPADNTTYVYNGEYTVTIRCNTQSRWIIESETAEKVELRRENVKMEITRRDFETKWEKAD